VILKLLGSILLGGGAIGAGTGWLLVRWLDARAEAVKRRVGRGPRANVIVAQRPAQRVEDVNLFAPGASWPVADPAEVRLWHPNWRMLRAEAHRHLRDPGGGFRPEGWPRDTWEGNDARHP